jgi:hypothetical protein
VKLKVPVRATSWVPGLVLVVVVSAGFLIPEPTAVPGGGLDGSGPIGGGAAAASVAGIAPEPICSTCIDWCGPAHPESPCEEYCDFPLCNPCSPSEALSGAGAWGCHETSMFSRVEVSAAKGVGQAGLEPERRLPNPGFSQTHVAVDRSVDSLLPQAQDDAGDRRRGWNRERSGAGEHDDCFACARTENHPTEEGWLCELGPEYCHWHGDVIAHLGDNYWLNGHPQKVWLNDECHNVCYPALAYGIVGAANDIAMVLREQPGQLSEAIMAMSLRGVAVRSDTAGGVIVVSATLTTCFQEFVIPAPGASGTGGIGPEGVSPLREAREGPGA